VINNKKVLAVIPARGGSKRLSRKNIENLFGRPLIGWAIDAANESKYIDRVIVSTEDKEIVNIAKSSGADIPFLRPNELAGDDITMVDVILHLLSTLEKKDERYDYVVLLQPTSPLRTARHIDEAFRELVEANQNAIVSVCEAEHHPLWCNTLPEDKSMTSFLSKEIHNLRSQDLPKYYQLNGAIYICDTTLLKNEKTFLPSEGCIAFIMSQEDSIDIDTQNDFNRAHLLFDKNIIEKSKLADQLFDNYTKKNYGELPKSENDILIFDFLVKKYCLTKKNKLLVDGEVDYSRIDKKTIKKLSIVLKINNEKAQEYISELSTHK